MFSAAYMVIFIYPRLSFAAQQKMHEGQCGKRFFKRKRSYVGKGNNDK
jgi:hypothetical protein